MVVAPAQLSEATVASQKSLGVNTAKPATSGLGIPLLATLKIRLNNGELMALVGNELGNLAQALGLSVNSLPHQKTIEEAIVKLRKNQSNLPEETKTIQHKVDGMYISEEPLRNLIKSLTVSSNNSSLRPTDVKTASASSKDQQIGTMADIRAVTMSRSSLSGKPNPLDKSGTSLNVAYNPPIPPMLDWVGEMIVERLVPTNRQGEYKV